MCGLLRFWFVGLFLIILIVGIMVYLFVCARYLAALDLVGSCWALTRGAGLHLWRRRVCVMLGCLLGCSFIYHVYCYSFSFQTIFFYLSFSLYLSSSYLVQSNLWTILFSLYLLTLHFTPTIPIITSTFHIVTQRYIYNYQ